MPRPNPPPPITRPAVHAFHLADSDKRDLARILARDILPPETAEAIAAAISAYKATEAGAAGTTIGNTVAALIELTRPTGRGYNRAVRRMSEDSSGVDDTTLATLQPLAKAVLAGKAEATESLSRAARARAAELQNHERVLPGPDRCDSFVASCVKSSGIGQSPRLARLGIGAESSPWKSSPLGTLSMPISSRTRSV
jgi:hypothetical protein